MMSYPHWCRRLPASTVYSLKNSCTSGWSLPSPAPSLRGEGEECEKRGFILAKFNHFRTSKLWPYFLWCTYIFLVNYSSFALSCHRYCAHFCISCSKHLHESAALLMLCNEWLQYLFRPALPLVNNTFFYMLTMLHSSLFSDHLWRLNFDFFCSFSSIQLCYPSALLYSL